MPRIDIVGIITLISLHIFITHFPLCHSFLGYRCCNPVEMVLCSVELRWIRIELKLIQCEFEVDVWREAKVPVDGTVFGVT